MLLKNFRRVYEWFVFLTNIVFDSLAPKLYSYHSFVNPQKNILIVRLDAIGDFILWLDSALELRKLYPVEQYRLVLIGNCVWTELASIQKIFDEVIPLDRKQFYYDLKYRMNMWRSLRSKEWDKVINPTYSRDFLFGDSVVRVCSAIDKIGSLGDLSNQSSWQKRISDGWYTKLIPASNMPLMELERNAEFIRGLGSQSFHAAVPKLVSDDQLPADLLSCEYIVLVPGASLPLRQWPVECFAKVARFIKSTYGFTVVICGTVSEKEQGARLVQLVQNGAIDYTGKTNLMEYVSIIKYARLLIGNESSAVHIAAAVGVKAFCLLGGRHFGRFLPYLLEYGIESNKLLPTSLSHHMDCFQCNNNCIYFAQNECCSAPCLEQISVEEVVNEVTTFLSSKSSKTVC